MSAFPQKWIAKVPETWQHICRHSHEGTGTEALRVAVQSGAAHREGREPAGSKDMHEEIPAWSSSRTGSKLPWRCSHTRLLFPYYP